MLDGEMLISTRLIAAVAALAQPLSKGIEPPPTVQIGTAQFSLLTGSRLESVLVGHSLTAMPCGSSDQCVQAFYERGRYAQSGDREVIQGSYALRGDRYCAGWDQYQFCAAVYQSGDDRLAVLNLNSGRTRPGLVTRRDAPTGSDWAPVDGTGVDPSWRCDECRH